MKSAELAAKVATVVGKATDYYNVVTHSNVDRGAIDHITTEAMRRILGIGAEQYSQGDTQKFETMPLDDLWRYLDEELLDIINYSVMLQIRLHRAKQALKGRYRDERGEPIL